MAKILKIQLTETQCENFDYKQCFYPEWQECEFENGVLIGESSLVNSILNYL